MQQKNMILKTLCDDIRKLIGWHIKHPQQQLSLRRNTNTGFKEKVYKIKICCFSFLMFGIASFSQNVNVNTKTLTQQFEQYQVNSLQEKLFVHTDKTFYLAGEIIWFKIYAVDGLLNKPLALSKVVYVEILNQEHKAVLQAKISMEDASGNGSFLIPNSIASGNYKLRAYTKWMKNFSPDFFYEQPVGIVNTFKALNIAGAKSHNTYDVQLFPEGGNLVFGLPSKVAFKVVNQNGDAVDCKGTLIFREKDTVLHFSTLKSGMGSFIFTPQKEALYTVMINLPDTIITKQISNISTQGYVMNVANTSNGFLKIAVHSTIVAANVPVYLFIHTRHLVKNVQANFLSDGETFFLVDKKILGEGISHLTIFDADKQPVCERLYFKNPENKLDIHLTADKNEYKTRDKVSIDLSTKDYSGRSVEADMSVSVLKIDSFQSAGYNHIENYLMLSSELVGKIDAPEYYFENIDSAAIQAADNLMLTQGWRRFKWDEVLQNKKPFFKFIPEFEGQVIDGMITNKITGAIASDIRAYLSVPGYNYTFKTSMSKPNGDIAFTVKDIYGLNDIILQTNHQTDSIYKIEMNNPYADRFSTLPLPLFTIAEKWKTELTNRSINVQAENAYITDKKIHTFSFSTIDTNSFYGLPDKQYYLDDYTRFVTMEEVIKEYIPDVRVRKYADNFQFRATNAPLKSFFDDSPLVLIDGVPVFTINRIMEFDPLKIKKIELTERKYFLSNLVSDGIVSFKTYQGDLGGYELDPDAIILEYDGLQQQREFYSPAYKSNEQITNRIPDFRNQLFWSPKIKTNTVDKTQLSFWTSDLTGKFVIIIQGITKEGLAGSKAIPFDVRLTKTSGKSL